jgi:hypothetical protein
MTLCLRIMGFLQSRNVTSWHNVRAQLGAFEGTKTAALPTLGIKGRFKVYGAGLEPMSALANSTFDRAGAANGVCGWPPHSKTFFEMICAFVRSSHVSGLFARF